MAVGGAFPWVSEGRGERPCLENRRFQLNNSQIDGNLLGIPSGELT